MQSNTEVKTSRVARRKMLQQGATTSTTTPEDEVLTTTPTNAAARPAEPSKKVWESIDASSSNEKKKSGGGFLKNLFNFGKSNKEEKPVAEPYAKYTVLLMCLLDKSKLWPIPIQQQQQQTIQTICLFQVLMMTRP